MAVVLLGTEVGWTSNASVNDTWLLFKGCIEFGIK
jgi:hypothetical protein